MEFGNKNKTNNSTRSVEEGIPKQSLGTRKNGLDGFWCMTLRLYTLRELRELSLFSFMKVHRLGDCNNWGSE